MKKKLLLLMLLVFVFSAGIVTAGTFAPNGKFDGFSIVKVFGGGKELKPDGTPGILYKGSTLVPLGLLRQFGIDVGWDSGTLSATIKMPPARVVYGLSQSQLDELTKYVYKVEAPLPDNPKLAHQGSGFIVRGTLITNAHVAADSATAQVMIDGQWQKASSYSFVNKDADLMGFKVAGGKELPVSTELPVVGDPVYDISFPHGTLKETEGTVTDVKMIGGITVIIHNAKTESGSSGGVLLSGKGEIIGINQGSITYQGDISHAIPSKYLMDELNK